MCAGAQVYVPLCVEARGRCWHLFLTSLHFYDFEQGLLLDLKLMGSASLASETDLSPPHPPCWSEMLCPAFDMKSGNPDFGPHAGRHFTDGAISSDS